MKTLVAPQILSDEETARLAGKFVDESYIKLLLENETVAVNRSDGSPLAILVKNAIGFRDAEIAYRVLLPAAVNSFNRGLAAGVLTDEQNEVDGLAIGKRSESRFKPLKKDGSVSKTTYATSVPSGLVGGFERNPRFPYCRLTAFSTENAAALRNALPFVQSASDTLKKYLPDRYAAQKSVCDRTHPDYIFPETCFSTITVNRTWRTALHTDKGDLPEGFGVLSVLSMGKYSGGVFVVPKYGVGVNIGHRDVLLVDVHEWHGNTEIVGVSKFFTRLSCVFYYRQKIVTCESLEKERQNGRETQTARLFQTPADLK